MKKKVKLFGLALLSSLVLVACGTSEVTSSSSSLWEQIIYAFARVIQFLSLNGNIGIGIILFTILIRTLLLPVYQFQMSSSRKMQEIQPRLRALQSEHRGDRLKIAEESQKLYKEVGVNPYATMLPLLIQLPVLLALYQALTRVEALKVGHFLWLNLSQSDPYLILPVLAAAFTFLSSWLTNKGMPEKNGLATAMTYLMPIMIFGLSLSISSGVALYWTVSNAYQVLQILALNNPFKLIAEREAKLQAEKERKARIRRAQKKARKKRK